MSNSVDYKTAPIGTVASDEFTTLVKNDKGWYWLEDRLQEDDSHVLPREVVHEFQLGEVVTPETLGWLPPGSEITPERKDHALVRNDNGGWAWRDGVPGTPPFKLVAQPVAVETYKLTKFPGLEENPYVVGKALEGEAAYEGAPEGTLVVYGGCKDTGRFKLANGEWRHLGAPLTEVESGHMCLPRIIVGFLEPGEVELLTTPPKADPRVKGTVRLDYTFNLEKGTVYSHSPHHRDFGKVVELPNGRFLAVPNRPVREFKTAQEAVEWLI